MEIIAFLRVQMGQVFIVRFLFGRVNKVAILIYTLHIKLQSHKKSQTR